MKTLLLFPPPGDTSQPYVALPALATALGRAGFESRIRDLNPEFFDYLREPAVHEELMAKVYDRLGTGPAGGWNDPTRALLLNDWDTERLDEAVEILKDPARYYQPDLFSMARRRIRGLYRLASAAAHPYELDIFRFTPPVSPLLPVGEVLAELEHPEGSPFHRFFVERVLPEVRDEAYGLVGLSVTYGQQLMPALHLAKLIKGVRPDLPVVMGGAAVTGYHQTFRAHPELFDLIDVLVLGDGETALVEIAGRVSEHRPVDANVPNVLLRAGQGVVAGPRYEEDLSTHGTPDYSSLDLTRYLVPEVTLLVPVTRGCTWGLCAFCNFDALRCSYRERPPEAVAQDLVTLQDLHGTRSFYLTGNTVRPKAMRLMAEAIEAAGRDLRWVVELRLDKAHKPETFRTMYRAGCRFVMLGLESASQRVQDLMNKGYKVTWFEPIIRSLAEAGIRVGIESFIGFPGETDEEAEQTADYLIEHKEHIAFFTLGTFVLDANSIVARDPERFGVRVTMPDGLRVEDCFPRFLPFERTWEGAPTEEHVQALDARLYRKLAEHYPYTLERFGQGIGGPDPTLYAMKYPTSFFHHRQSPKPPPPLESARDLVVRVPGWIRDTVVRRLPRSPFPGDSGPAPTVLVREEDGSYLALAPEARDILDLVDGRRTVTDLVKDSGAPTKVVVEVVLALADEGYLELRRE